MKGVRAWRGALALVAVFVATAWPAAAGDFKCLAARGCDASALSNGKLVTVHFAYHSTLSTEGGWVVRGENGWLRLT